MFISLLKKITPLYLAISVAVGMAYATEYDVVRSLGDANAPVVVHEFSSMTCPHCRNFHKTAMHRLKKEYIDTGKVRLVMHQIPLDNVATVTAMLGLSLPQDKYFGFIEYAFKNQNQLRQKPLETLQSWARLSGLNLDEVSNNQDLLTAIIRQKNIDTKKYNVEGTPTIWINDSKVAFHPNHVDDFFKYIDKIYAKSK